MSPARHSPAPFSKRKALHGWLVVDALGDAVGGAARKTGDHSPEEQEANADLFTASPLLLASLKACLGEIDEEIEQRRHSGNDECWAVLQAISNEGHRAVRLAETGA